MRMVMTAEDIARTLQRMAHEIVERYNRDLPQGVIVGIRTRGLPLAERLRAIIAEITERTLPLGVLDITLYRDDLTQVGPVPLVRKTELPGAIDGRTVFLVDDVLFTGRTVRAALDALIDYGRPRAVRLVVLIDRNHRELPIQADIVGMFVPTRWDEVVHVLIHEVDGRDVVLVGHRAEPIETEGDT